MTPMCLDRSAVSTGHVAPNIRQDVACAIRCDARVLITGEVGAKAVAELIHRNSARSAGPFRTLACAARPDGVLDAKLFGRARASAGGVERDTRGLLEQADGGTIFIANIGQIGIALQARLLQFLEQGAIRRVGADVAHTRVDVRIIASADRRLFERTVLQTFREELYYRLNVLHLVMPPM